MQIPQIILNLKPNHYYKFLFLFAKLICHYEKYTYLCIQKTKLIPAMNNKSILMPHTCQKIGWCFLIIFVILELAKALFVHNIDVAWYFAKASHATFIISIFLICLSKEKVEDEMISGFRLKSIGVVAYVFFVLFLILSLFLELRLATLFPSIPEDLELYMSEAFLIFLPLLLFILYFGIFKWMLWKSKKQQAL